MSPDVATDNERDRSRCQPYQAFRLRASGCQAELQATGFGLQSFSIGVPGNPGVDGDGRRQAERAGRQGDDLLDFFPRDAGRRYHR